MPSPLACSQPTFKSAWTAAAAPSTTSSANAYGAASSTRTSISTSHDTVRQLQVGLSAYFDFKNHERPHQSLNYRTPVEEHFVLCSEPAVFA
ncbi:MAG: transposase [Caldilineaceae bacterium SB0662_bin_9]|uniref:Transposase n=1 Tax=Caldilineaceae bacterium SB0662_bin_9 TaxID=2605258 RepID=A0A6B1DRI4_9CHLR|nr:transposase [Caldilineaceae bacterium SB0662_bin_9]